MRTRLIVAGIAAAAAATAIAAPAAGSPTADARRYADTPLLLTFDNRETLRSGTSVRDASGHGNRGIVRSANGGRITPTNGWMRRGADFVPGRGSVIIEVDDARALDPRRRSFVLGAAVRVSRFEGARNSNVVQKGYFRQAGGQYKLQINAGRPSCVVTGALGRVRVEAQRSIANDRWHRLSCTRTPTKVTLRVDGKVRASVAEPSGWVSNTSAVRIGGKNLDTHNDQFRGDLDSVYLRYLPQR